MKPKLWPCKEGTIPESVILRYNYKPRIGLLIEYRHPEHGQNDWRMGKIWKIIPGGYFFIDRM